MSYRYTKEDIAGIIERSNNGPFIVVMTNGEVNIGYLAYDDMGLRLLPLSGKHQQYIRRIDISKIIDTFSGNVYCKQRYKNRIPKTLGILEFADLVEKAGYDLI